MDVIRKSEENFTMIRLDTKHKTLQNAFEAFKNRKTQHGTSALEISESPPILFFHLERTSKDNFIFPNTLTLNLANKSNSDKIQEEADEIEKKIMKI